MAFKTGTIFITLVLGCLAIPTPESDDMSRFFDEHFEDANSRIVGGNVAANGAHPHMAALTSGSMFRSFQCGGSVLSQRSILTAAHCINAFFSFGSLSSSLRVTVGTNRWNQGGQTLRLSGNATHQHYVAATIKNDIGLLFTSTDIQFNNLVRPISLSFDYVGAGVQARVAGWGRTSVNAALSAQLREVQVPITDGQACVRDAAQASVTLNIRAPPVEPHIELCAFHSPGQGTCRGDSGSALVRIDSGEQIGVVSWGFPCALGAPDVFARVSAFQDWINQHKR